MLEQALRTFGRALETGLGTRREAEEYLVHPNVIKGLLNGQAVVIHKGGGFASVVDLVPMPRE